MTNRAKNNAAVAMVSAVIGFTTLSYIPFVITFIALTRLTYLAFVEEEE